MMDGMFTVNGRIDSKKNEKRTCHYHDGIFFGLAGCNIEFVHDRAKKTGCQNQPFLLSVLFDSYVSTERTKSPNFSTEQKQNRQQ